MNAEKIKSHLRPRCFLAVFAGAVAAIGLGGPHAATAQQRPNVLFIVIDDLNDWIGCLGGHPQARTPHIDSVARRGVLFTNAHCAAPLCNPSRAATFSGSISTQPEKSWWD